MVRVGVGLWEVPSSNPNETKNRKKKKKIDNFIYDFATIFNRKCKWPNGYHFSGLMVITLLVHLGDPSWSLTIAIGYFWHFSNYLISH